MGILQRYVLRELLIDFSYTLSVITSIFFIALAAQLLYTFHEFNVLAILGLFPLLVPTSLAYTIPVSVMIASVLTFGRLTAEREILAMRTSGIHLGRVTLPALLLGLVLAGGTFYINSTVIPACHRKQTRVKQDAFEKFLASFDRGVKLTSFDRFQLAWTKRDESGRMRGIFFMRLTEKGAIEEQVRAQSGRLFIDQATNRLHLSLNDVDLAFDRDRESSSSAAAATAAARKPERAGGAGPGTRPRAGAAPEVTPSAPGLDTESAGVASIASDAANPLRPRESDLVATRFDSLSLSYSLDELFEPNKKAPRLRERPTHNLRAELASANPPDAARRAEVETEIESRSANAFACFAFALIGTPLGILVRRGNRLVAFFVSFLVVALLYYPLAMLGEALGSVGKVPPIVSVWWANGALVAIGIVLLRAVYRR